MKPVLQARRSGGGSLRELEREYWRLELPSGSPEMYRLAQLDDYMQRARKDFPWRPPLRLELSARVSANDLPGTWGFGLWNEPFTAGFVAGTAQHLPALPNTAWFFYAAPPNYLAFRDDHPAQGLLAAVFSAARLPGLLLAPGALAAPLLLLPATARLLRKLVRILLKEDAALVATDATQWHSYRLDWEQAGVQFFVDGCTIYETSITPSGPLGLVIWIDNQYAAFPPDGKLRFGTSANPVPVWLEIKDIVITPLT